MNETDTERALVEYARTKRLTELLGAPFFYHEAFRCPVPPNDGSFNLRSELYDIAGSFEGRVSNRRGYNGILLLCDEFSVQITLDDEPLTTYGGLLTTLPVLSTGQLIMEVVTTKGSQNDTPTFAMGGGSSDLIAPFQNGKGVMQSYTPGARAFRFRAFGTVTTTSAPASAILMHVTGRLRNEAGMLMALDRILRAQGKAIGVLQKVGANGAITRSLELCS